MTRCRHYLLRSSLVLFLTLLFLAAFFVCPGSTHASGNLSNVMITKTYESTTKYFYDGKPVVTGNISGAVQGVTVNFNNVDNGNNYFVTVSSLSISSFTTASDCFSPQTSGTCQANLPDGVYQVSIEATTDLFSNPEVYTFPKYLAKVPTGSTVDTVAPAAPILDNLTSPVDADSTTISGSAEDSALISVTGMNQTKTLQLGSGNGRFAITVNLKQNSLNIFSVTATDATGNISVAATISMIESSQVLTPATSSGQSQVNLTAKTKTSNASAVQNTDSSSQNTNVAVNPITASNNETKPDQATAGTVKGVATKTTINTTALFSLYFSFALFIIVLGMHLGKRFFKHRAARNLDNSSKIDKHRKTVTKKTVKD